MSSLNTHTHTHKKKAAKFGDKYGKALYTLMNNAVYGETTKNLRNKIDVRLVSNKKKKKHSKWTIAQDTYKQTKIKKVSKEKVTYSLIYLFAFFVHKKHLRRRKLLV